jgi:uncharacterized membrane protein
MLALLLKKVVAVDALSQLDNHDLKIQREEEFTYLSELEHSNIKFPIHTDLKFNICIKVPGLRDK